MVAKSPNRYLDQLRVLVGHEVEFIVVGGVAAILEGAPISTFDLDIVYRRSDENNARLHQERPGLKPRRAPLGDGLGLASRIA